MRATAVLPGPTSMALRVLLALVAAMCALGLGAAGTGSMGGETGSSMVGMPAMAGGAIVSTAAAGPAALAAVHDPAAGDPMDCPRQGKGQASSCTGLTGGHAPLYPDGPGLAARPWSPSPDLGRIGPAVPVPARGPSPAAPPDLHALNVLRV